MHEPDPSPDAVPPDPELTAAAQDGDEARLLDAVRDWVERHVPGEWLRAARDGDLNRLHEIRTPEQYREWYPVLGRSGLVVPSWPVEYGGLGVGDTLARVVQAELAACRLTVLNVVGIALAAPTLMEWGTPEQCRRLLPRIADNTDTWCQLFSEPGAGSDLAGLSTRAVPVANGWRVTGQKIWSSFAHEAQMGILLARTDPDVPKHQGITAFALPMDQEGVLVRPLRKINGEAEFNEVFLDAALVSDENRIGEPGQGWPVARTVLAHERRMLSGAGSGVRERTSGSSVERLLELACREQDGRRPIDDPLVADTVAQLVVENTVLRVTNKRNRALGGRATDPGLIKIMSSEHNQRLQQAFLRLLGERGLAQEPGDAEAERIVFGYLRSRGDTIGGGTSEVHRNNLAERTLGLPKDPFSDNKLPWRDIQRGA
ncbi:acyl-CoA dehydrogenase [Amycolatopsis bartoniae]|nr:acyl-CoA dehydrogenase [Amycolatopsis bartoniae]